jgi:hypothetical protein
MEQLFKDVRFAFRGLSKSPGFTLAVVVILALGVGATTAIFTMANAAFLRPLPVEDPDRLVGVYTTDQKNPASSAWRVTIFVISVSKATRLPT